MLTFTHGGVSLFDYDNTTNISKPNEFTLRLSKYATIGNVRRFITRELMEGIQYRDVLCKQLAVAIYAAFANPMLQYIEQGHSVPLWYQCLSTFVMASAERKHAQSGQGRLT